MTYDYFYMDESEQYQFLQMPWLLIKDEQFKNLSSDSKILYSLLLNRTSLSKKNNWRDENGRVYLIYTVDEIKDDLNCGRDKAIKSMQELTKIGLVETIRRGLGKPNLIFVKNFATSLKNTPPDRKEPSNPVNTQKSDLSTSGNRKSRPLEVDISDSSNTYIINTDVKSKSKSKSKSETLSAKEKDDMTLTMTLTPDPPTHIEISENKRGLAATVSSTGTGSQSHKKENTLEKDYTAYRLLLQENIEYFHYLKQRKSDIEMVEELLNCMLDVIFTYGETVKIGGEDKNRQMVISQYMKINSMDIDHILNKYREQRHRITHLHSYLKTMLYTVKQEARAWAENATRADGVVW